MKIEYTLFGIEDTQRIAIILSKYLQGVVILLSGDIGAGKTTFASFFINALSTVPQNITSPTFPIVQSYETTIGTVYHLDLYRIENEIELRQLGLEEILLNTCLIEWSEKLGSYTPKHFVKINIINEGTTRKMIISFSKKYEDIFKAINHDL
ncbi:MAG: tRNA (adenosine(37)-N6)-threonylcarbamoyltransferase complex ATPase subunit type 1 TsaE [Alphaproteobacteria bacterium]|jgi:tRNA threonylcarbamoyladenosine biosynthesis protein TsaE|nr:tRNA (adenosine(37)-N6)-threonylcarbamoyltransferase complex ATPase subunit type 1 TsaE [Alphaproteobacteria bacterium]